MNKELEALERLFFNLETNDYFFRGDASEDYDIIETALKDYEYQTIVFKKLTEPKLQILSKKEIKQLKKSSGYITEYKGIYVDENTNKKLKAFEIIKEKRVDVTTLFDCCNAKEYNRWVDVRSHYSYRPFEITQEEFDSLKEVLL